MHSARVVGVPLMQLKKGHGGLHGQGEIQARRANGEKDGRARGLWMRCHPRTTAGTGVGAAAVALPTLLPLLTRSSDHTLMHVARTRIQTRGEAANRRAPESDLRSFHHACQCQCHRFLPTASTIHNRLLHGPRRSLPAEDAVTSISLPYRTDRAHVTIIECTSDRGGLVVRGWPLSGF